MQELDDMALLRDYVALNSEEAFATLVKRHIDRVYSISLRHVHDSHHAEEITQAVFVILARKAGHLRKGVVLEGWLYQTARLTALMHIRSEIRRARREQEAQMQTASHENETEMWTQIAPLLDAALARLNETDRNAVVLRFFYGKSLKDVGATLGAREDAARVRINRALEKLRAYFSRHGVTSTAETIAGTIAINSLRLAPVALAGTSSAAALAKGTSASVSTSTLVKGALKAMAWSKAKSTFAAGVVALVLAGVVTIAATEVLRASTADHNLQARFEKSLKNAKDISNVEIKWIDTLWIGDPEVLKLLDTNRVTKEFSRTFEYSFTAVGPKFRATCKLVSGTETNLVKLTEAAFDGKTYVAYTGDFGQMSKRSKSWPAGNAEAELNPLTAPFMFLSKDGDDCIQCFLRSTDIASGEFAKGFVLPAPQSLDDLLQFSFPGAPFEKQATTWKVALDKAGDAFTPRTIQLLMPGMKSETVRTLLDYTNLGAYQFPTRIAWTCSSYPSASPPSVTMTGMVTVVSARIPDQIADSVFKLDEEEKSAKRVWDWDQKRFTKSARRSTNP